MSERPRSKLEPSPTQLREMVSLALEHITTYLETLPDRPASDLQGAEELARSLAEPPPELGRPLEELLDLVFGRASAKGFSTAGPGYLAYVPGGGIVHSALADLIADALNRYVGVWVAAPGLVQLEANVIRWLAEMMGYPPRAGGYLASGGSLANFSAVFTARREKLGDDVTRGALYASDQVHHSVVRAAVLAGFPPERVRLVASDVTHQIRVDELERRIAEDRAAGLLPFLVVGSAGTTNSGAIDDLGLLADLAQREKLWLHVDAAYGGFFRLTDRGRRLLADLPRADSITLDPHKGLFLPFGTGCLLVRDLETLRRAHTIQADYMPALQADPSFVDFCEISPELSRDFRGLRVWLPLTMLGIGTFRDALDEKLDLAAWAADEIRGMPDMELVAPPRLSLLAFRVRPPGLDDDEEVDELNERLLERINARRRVLLTGTRLRGRFVIRICVLSFRTHRDRVAAALEDIRDAVAEVMA